MKICIRENITLCLTGKNTTIIERIVNVGKELKLSTNVLQIFRELDEAIGWCEDQILLKFTAGNSSNQVMNTDELLNDLIEDDEAVATIVKYFKKETISEGEVLFKQGDTGNSLYLILGGAISIVINLPDGHSVTVRTMRAGSILGEMAVYTGAPRTASAVARRDSVLFKLSTKDYQSLVLSHPSEAHLFSTCIIKIMAERLARSNKSVLALAR
jgi:SulP family sulfate permease